MQIQLPSYAVTQLTSCTCFRIASLQASWWFRSKFWPSFDRSHSHSSGVRIVSTMDLRGTDAIVSRLKLPVPVTMPLIRIGQAKIPHPTRVQNHHASHWIESGSCSSWSVTRLNPDQDMPVQLCTPRPQRPEQQQSSPRTKASEKLWKERRWGLVCLTSNALHSRLFRASVDCLVPACRFRRSEANSWKARAAKRPHRVGCFSGKKKKRKRGCLKFRVRSGSPHAWTSW
jgi:hypothetical protein